MKKSRLNKAEKSWVLYDVGNSAFALVVVTVVMPLFFKDIISEGVGNGVSTSRYAFGTSLASLMVAVLAPVLGAMADGKGMKKKFFLFFMSLGVLLTLLLTLPSEGNWILCLSVYIGAKVGFSGANIFYDAFLVDVAGRERMDWVSVVGFGWGYAGSIIPFLAVCALFLFAGDSEQGSSIPRRAVRWSFVVVAVWWVLFSLPLIKNVRQKHFVEETRNPVREGVYRLLATLRQVRRYWNVVVFLLAYFFYIDGVYTIYTMATTYGRDIGLDALMLILAVLMIQLVAFPFALLFGRLSERFGPKRMIHAGLGIYTVVASLAYLLPSLPQSAKEVLFWVLAFLVGTSQGGVQALSRSLFARLIPRDKSCEFFGFYNIFGKSATILGPALMGFVTHLTGHSRYGILSILALFVLGSLLLGLVKVESNG